MTVARRVEPGRGRRRGREPRRRWDVGAGTKSRRLRLRCTCCCCRGCCPAGRRVRCRRVRSCRTLRCAAPSGCRVPCNLHRRPYHLHPALLSCRRQRDHRCYCCPRPLTCICLLHWLCNANCCPRCASFGCCCRRPRRRRCTDYRRPCRRRAVLRYRDCTARCTAAGYCGGLKGGGGDRIHGLARGQRGRRMTRHRRRYCPPRCCTDACYAGCRHRGRPLCCARCWPSHRLRCAAPGCCSCRPCRRCYCPRYFRG